MLQRLIQHPDHNVWRQSFDICFRTYPAGRLTVATVSSVELCRARISFADSGPVRSAITLEIEVCIRSRLLTDSEDMDVGHHWSMLELAIFRLG